ncbi:MAG: hypothetical protein ACN4GG_11065 [Akkermansiaceae bacterium]
MKQDDIPDVGLPGGEEQLKQYFSVFSKFMSEYLGMAHTSFLERQEPEKAQLAQIYQETVSEQLNAAEKIISAAYNDSEREVQKGVDLLISSSGLISTGNKGIEMISSAKSSSKRSIWSIIGQIAELLKELLGMLADMFPALRKIFEVIIKVLEIIEKIMEFLAQLFGGKAAKMAKLHNETMWRNLQYHWDTLASWKRANGDIPYAIEDQA